MSDMGFQVFVGSICFELREFEKYLTFFPHSSSCSPLFAFRRSFLLFLSLSRFCRLPSYSCWLSQTLAGSVILLLLIPSSCLFPLFQALPWWHELFAHEIITPVCWMPNKSYKRQRNIIFVVINVKALHTCHSKILTNSEHSFDYCLNCLYLDVNCPI